MVGERVDGQILFGARSEKPKIVFGARDEKGKIYLVQNDSYKKIYLAVKGLIFFVVYCCWSQFSLIFVHQSSIFRSEKTYKVIRPK